MDTSAAMAKACKLQAGPACAFAAAFLVSALSEKAGLDLMPMPTAMAAGPPIATRALIAADLGLSEAAATNITRLQGTVTEAAGVRIVSVGMIETAEGSAGLGAEIAPALQNMIGSARAAEMSVLQIEGTFANARLEKAASYLVSKAGGQVCSASETGATTFTFLLK